MKSRKKFAELMALMGELFDKKISPLLAETYWKILENFNDNECEAAFKHVIKTSKFFPKPVDFLEYLHGDGDNATEAWAMVDQAMRGIGPYESIDFGDRKIHACIEILGGWDYLGTLTEDEWKWKRKEFESLYRGISATDGPDHVLGLAEKQNARLCEGELRGYLPLPQKFNNNVLKLVGGTTCQG